MNEYNIIYILPFITFNMRRRKRLMFIDVFFFVFVLFLRAAKKYTTTKKKQKLMILHISENIFSEEQCCDAYINKLKYICRTQF